MKDNSIQTFTHSCFATLRNGRWSRWQLLPDSHYTMLAQCASANGDVLFQSVQQFDVPENFEPTTWTHVRNKYRGDDATFRHIAPLYFDVDCEGNLDKALELSRWVVDFFRNDLEISEADIKVFFSGSKGTHILINPVVLGIAPAMNLTDRIGKIANNLANDLTKVGAPSLAIDSQVYSLPRMLRCDNQLNPKSGLFKIRLRHEELFQLDSKSICDLAKHPRTIKWPELSQKSVQKTSDWWQTKLASLDREDTFKRRTLELTGVKVRPDGYAVDELLTSDMPACIQVTAKSNPPPGKRNRCELQLACWFKSARKSQQEASGFLFGWTSNNRPELSSEAARQKAESIIKAVYDNCSYGFSCSAARSAAGTRIDCESCKVIKPRSLRQIFSIRTHYDLSQAPICRKEILDGRKHFTRQCRREFRRYLRSRTGPATQSPTRAGKDTHRSGRTDEPARRSRHDLCCSHA